MKTIQHIQGSHYKAEEGAFIIRKSDNAIIGEEIYLSSNDTISRYKAKAYTEDEYNEFYKDKQNPKEMMDKYKNMFLKSHAN